MATVVPISVWLFLFCCRDRNEALTTIQIPSERREERCIIDQCCSLTWPVLIGTLGAPTEQVGADSCGWWVVQLPSHWQRRLLRWLPIIKKKTGFKLMALTNDRLISALPNWNALYWHFEELRSLWLVLLSVIHGRAASPMCRILCRVWDLQYTTRFDVELQWDIN